MRKTNFTVSATLAVSVLVAALAWARGGYSWLGENPAEHIKRLHEQERQSALRGDSSFAETYLADEYVGVGGDGQVRTKAEAIQLYRSVKYESINERSVKIRTYGDTVIVNTESAVKFTFNGKSNSGDFRAIFVWAKLKGSWKEVASQMTQIAPATH